MKYFSGTWEMNFIRKKEEVSNQYEVYVYFATENGSRPVAFKIVNKSSYHT